MKVDYNPYEGREVTGATDTVISRGRVIVDGGTFTGRAGRRVLPEATHAMTGDEIIALSKKHTIFEWAVQGAVDPIPVARAKGVYFWTPEGKRFIDFNSQLMCVNIGHGDPRVVKAIQDQAAVLTYVTPAMATEPRARLGAKLAALTPGDHRRLLLHQRRRRGQRERLQDRARVHRPAEDPRALSLVSWRHGGGDCRHRRAEKLEPGTAAGHRPCARPVSRDRARMGIGGRARFAISRR